MANNSQKQKYKNWAVKALILSVGVLFGWLIGKFKKDCGCVDPVKDPKSLIPNGNIRKMSDLK